MVAWLVGLISHHFTFKLSTAEISEKLESLRCRSLEKRSRTRRILAEGHRRRLQMADVRCQPARLLFT